MNLLDAAEWVLSAYATLQKGEAAYVIDTLTDTEFGAKEEKKFSERYPAIVSRYDDTQRGASLSATLFKDTADDTARNLVLAIRGTLERAGTPNDLTLTLRSVTVTRGCDQAVAIASW